MDTNSKLLERIQRRAARFVKGDYSRYGSVTSMLKDLNWEPLANRRNNRLCLLFKTVNGLVAIPAETHMKFSTRLSCLGRQKTITVIGSKKDPYKYSFFPSTTSDWNQLPKTSVTSKTIEEFKASLTSTSY